MSRQSPCANSKATGCEGFVTQRGVIFCDVCTEVRKNTNKARREQSFEDLVNRNKELETEVQNLRKSKHEIELEMKEHIDTISKLREEGKEYIEKSKYIVYNDQWEKENTRMVELVVKLRNENDTLVKERENYHILYSQVNIDNQKLVLENIRLGSANESLKEQNQDLLVENEMLRSK